MFFKPNTSIYRNRLKWSIIISVIGLIENEFITIYTPGRGVFIGMILYGQLLGKSVNDLNLKVVTKPLGSTVIIKIIKIPTK